MVNIWCKFCSTYIAAKKWTAHLTCKQHKKNLPSKIIVQGVFEEEQIEEITENFTRFGRIAKREIVRSDTGETFIQYFYEDPSAYNLVAHKQHSLFGKPLKVTWVNTSEKYVAASRKNRVDSKSSLTTEDSERSVSDSETEVIPWEFFNDVEKPNFLPDLNENEYLIKQLSNHNFKTQTSSETRKEKRSHDNETASTSLCKLKKICTENSKKENLISKETPAAVPPPDPSVIVLNKSILNGNPRPVDKPTNLFKHKESIDQLFAQKKISLSDYLTITHKKTVKPLDLIQAQKKTKILTVCEAAIRAMSYKPVKPIRIRDFPQQPKKPRSSPLQKSVTKFKFTTPKKESFSLAFHALLRHIGIIGRETDVYKLIDSVAESLSSSDVVNKKISAEMLQISLLGSKANKEKKSGTESGKLGKKSISVQVDMVPKYVQKENKAVKNLFY